MKVALLSEGRHPVYGGGQIHVAYLMRLLRTRHAIQVDLFTRKLVGEDGKRYTTDELTDEGVRIRRVGPAGSFFNVPLRIISLVTMTVFLRRKAKKEKYDIIHAHALLPGIPAKIVGWLLGIPVVYTVHGTMHLDAHKAGVLRRVEKLLVCKMVYDLEISVSSKIFSYPNNNTNIAIIYNGVDLTHLAALPPQSKYTGLSFLTVGRMDRQKNHQIIIQAIRVLGIEFCKHYALSFVWVGDGSEKAQLEEQVRTYGLQEIVHMRGKLPYEETLIEFKKAHVFLLPSLGEGQPLTVLEAYGSALPVIATDVGDNSSFVISHTNGLLIPAGSVDALVDAIRQCAQCEEKTLQERGANGYALVQDYTREECTRRVVQEYKKLAH